MKEPLQPHGELRVGCGDVDGLLLRGHGSRRGTSDITYIKIFATKERTRFSFLMQQRKSLLEERLRGLARKLK